MKLTHDPADGGVAGMPVQTGTIDGPASMWPEVELDELDELDEVVPELVVPELVVPELVVPELLEVWPPPVPVLEEVVKPPPPEDEQPTTAMVPVIEAMAAKIARLRIG
jgi:hypothetical protein